MKLNKNYRNKPHSSKYRTKSKRNNKSELPIWSMHGSLVDSEKRYITASNQVNFQINGRQKELSLTQIQNLIQQPK